MLKQSKQILKYSVKLLKEFAYDRINKFNIFIFDFIIFLYSFLKKIGMPRWISHTSL